jgi:hypothetical protein
MNSEFPISYKGYKIYEEVKADRSCRNPISGHEWTDNKATGKFRIAGGRMISRVFTTVAKAREHIDFYDKWFPKTANSE